MMELPSTKVINTKRISRFKQRISDTLAEEELGFFTGLMEQYMQENDTPAIEIAAALAKLYQGNVPLLLTKPDKKQRRISDEPRRDRSSGSTKKSPGKPDEGKERYRIEVGHEHGVKPGNIVGTIANEIGLDGDHIGRINIYDDYSTIDLPDGIPPYVFEEISKLKVAGQQLNISKAEDADKDQSGKRRRKSQLKRGRSNRKRNR